MTPSDPIAAIQSNLRSRAAQVVGGITGVSTLAVLAAAAVLPGTALALPPIVAWLRGIGGNQFATWIDAWWRGQHEKSRDDWLAALAYISILPFIDMKGRLLEKFITVQKMRATIERPTNPMRQTDTNAFHRLSVYNAVLSQWQMRRFFMGADAFVAYYGVRFTFTDEAVLSQLENGTHPLILASKAGGLEYWWDLNPDSDVEYTLFIGIELAMVGVEYDARSMLTDDELNALMTTVRQGLQDAQIAEIPAFYMQLYVDS